MKVCSYEDKISNCQRPVKCKGVCASHYFQLREIGYLKPHKADIPVRMRFMQYVLIKVDGSGCWQWFGSLYPDGYGQINIGNYPVRAHRFAWEMVNGIIPDNKFIDHMCFNRACVNVDHLRLATNKENLENHNGARRNSKTGVRGVFLNERTQKYQVRAKHNGKSYSGGYFSDLAEAEQAAKDLRNKLHTHNNADRKERINV